MYATHADLNRDEGVAPTKRKALLHANEPVEARTDKA